MGKINQKATMNTIVFLALLSSTFLFSACTAVQTGSDVAQGRQALFAGNNQAALGYFQRAAQTDPNYVYGTELRAGVLSYLGRAQYLNGDLPQARQTLERALSQHKSDNVARLYLGLTLARQGDRQRGLTEIEASMKGIHSFLDYLNENFRYSFGRFWDPNRDIRKLIEGDLAMISKGNVDWQRLIADGESLGIRIEREGDFARQQEEQEQDMEGEGIRR
jgi:tetratricopeptide (TPR) repeat protein